MKIRSGMVLCLLTLWLVACGDKKPTVITPPMVDKHADSSQLAAPLAPDALRAQVPLLADYQQRVQAALQANPPVLLLNEQELPDAAAQTAQKLAVANPEFLQFTRNEKGEALRNEIMTVRKALAGDFQGAMGACAQTECWRVEMYNHFDNASTIAFVDVKQQQVLGVSRQSYAQPDLSPRLIALASAIANAADRKSVV